VTTTICSLEPFLYSAAPIDVVAQMTSDFYGAPEAEVGPIAGSPATSNQVNENALEDYLERFRAAICADITDLEARVVALEGS